MSVQHSFDIKKLTSKLRRLKRTLPRAIGEVAVKHFKKSFRNQGFTDVSLEKWPERKGKKRRRRRATLVKSGALRRSIRRVSTSHKSVTVGSDLPYAQIHNEGGKITTTQQVSSHKRKAHKRKVKGRRRKARVPEHQVKAHSRKVNTKIPQRQFIGNSKQLDKSILTFVDRRLKETISKHAL